MSLANIDFGTKQITIFGTQSDPLVKCTDIIVKLLEYRDTSKAKWFDQMKTDPSFVVKEGQSQMMFTEIGLYKALMKSNKPIAEEFQKKVFELLKNLRMQTVKMLEDRQRELEEEAQRQITFENSHPASVYLIKRRNPDGRTTQTIYAGRDISMTQSRVQTHFNERSKIMSQYQFIDIALASMSLEEIEIEQIPCLKKDADQLERHYIQTLNPPCNQTLNTENIHKCQRCHKVYKYRGWLQRHECPME